MSGTSPAQLVEHRAHLGRLHARLVVVEQEVVVLVRGLEALDVLLLQVDHLLEIRLEHRPVRTPRGLFPDGDGIAAVRELRELGRNADELVVVAADDADEAASCES